MSSSIAAFAMSQCRKRRGDRKAQAPRGPAPADKRGRRPARGGGGHTHPSVGGTGGGGAHPRGPVGPGGKPQEAVHTAWKRRGRRSNESAGDGVKIIHPNQSDEPDQGCRPTAQAPPRGKHEHDIPPPPYAPSTRRFTPQSSWHKNRREHRPWHQLHRPILNRVINMKSGTASTMTDDAASPLAGAIPRSFPHGRTNFVSLTSMKNHNLYKTIHCTNTEAKYELKSFPILFFRHF